jgi:ketosteroid isomerase-like protein
MSMPRRRFAAAAVIIGGAVLAVAGFTIHAQAQSADEEAVAENVEAFRKAMQANDRAGFEALCAPQMSYGHSGGKVQTKEEFIAEATSGKFTWKTLELADVKNSVAGDNAISRFMLKGELESEGKVTSINIGVLMVWQKQENAWKLLARQAFKV